MLNYLKEKMEEQFGSTTTEPIDDSVVLEYAHLFQELDDLSVDGLEFAPGRNMGAIDIPLEEDLELSTIEINIGDGRVTDIPMDATLQESYLGKMKTLDDFYQEAMVDSTPFPRESDIAFSDRCYGIASKRYGEYRDKIVQEGLFGFGKIDINDDRVPATAVIDFGPYGEGKRLSVKLDVLFEVDKKHRILKKQLDSIEYVTKNDSFVGLAPVIHETLLKKNETETNKAKTVWDLVTPKRLIVPVDPIDSYKVIVAFDCDFLDDELYFSYTIRIGNAKFNRGKADTTSDKIDVATISNKVLNTIKSKKQVIKETAVMNYPSRFGNLYQEAIDFGEGGSDGPPDPNDGGDTGDTSVTATADGDAPNVGDDSSTTDDTKTVPIENNDVSDQIAQNVADDLGPTDDNNEPTTGDTSEDGNDNNDDTDIGDTGNDDNDDDDSSLDDLDDAGNTDMGLDDTDVDVDNMTIDELLAQGSDRLKGMTIQQLKDFLSTGDSTTTTTEAYTTEAFILTKKNINEEIDINLRNALGILNDSEMSIEQLFEKFKKESKKLNRVLSKAAKMKNLYSENERAEFSKLNKCLVDLTTILKSSKDTNYVSTIKGLIKAFISQSALVAKIVEDKKNDGGGKE